MCVILIGKSSAILDLELDAAWESNPDGAGYYVRDNQRSYVQTGVMKLAELVSQLERIATKEIVLHLRLGTHGAVNAKNCHPFRIAQDGWLFHNGIASGFGRAGRGGESDSAHLARVLGRMRAADRVPVLQGIGGKFAMLNGIGRLTTIGGFEKCGKDKDVSASNLHWQFTYGSGAYDWSEARIPRASNDDTATNAAISRSLERSGGWSKRSDGAWIYTGQDGVRRLPQRLDDEDIICS